MLLNTLFTVMPTVTLPSLGFQRHSSPPPLVNEQCPTLCLLSSAIFLFSSPLVQHGDFFLCSAALSGCCVALRQQAWTAAVLRSRRPAICVLPSSAQRLFEQTDAAVNKHYLSEAHVVQAGPLATALNMAAP